MDDWKITIGTKEATFKKANRTFLSHVEYGFHYEAEEGRGLGQS